MPWRRSLNLVKSVPCRWLEHWASGFSVPYTTLKPAATAYGPEACFFGSAVGGKISSVKSAWGATCRRAHIADLQSRDLRREFGSRLRESGASDHDVRDFLGHANITTPSR